MRWIFLNLPNPSGRTMALGLTQPLTERVQYQEFLKIKEPGGKSAAGAYGLQPCRYLSAVCLSNVGASTSRNPMGLHGL
jgi:hypothetical protein